MRKKKLTRSEGTDGNHEEQIDLEHFEKGEEDLEGKEF